jgi:outer membrane protein OmpA-like peptidoglycan-associated protein
LILKPATGRHRNQEINDMRKSAIAIIAASSIVFATPALAGEKSQRNEGIGVGSGAVIGAFAGGPLGFVIGAAIGAKLGNNFDEKNDRIAGLEQSVEDSTAYVARLERNLDTLGAEVERLQSLSRPELIDLMQAGIEMDVLFRTDEDVLTDTTGDRLAQLAGTLSSMPDIHIQLDGFADERGAKDYNQALSERRVEFIRDQLVAAGIRPDRINTSAHGESIAQDQSSDSFALERRVSVKLFLDNTPSLASN